MSNNKRCPNFSPCSPPFRSRFPMYSVRNGLNYSTPFTATLVSLLVHTVALWIAVFLTIGITAGRISRRRRYCHNRHSPADHASLPLHRHPQARHIPGRYSA